MKNIEWKLEKRIGENLYWKLESGRCQIDHGKEKMDHGSLKM